jgi:elongation factor P--beta-lysine ligase
MADNVQYSLKIRDWDAATKLAGIIALVAGGVWSVWVYHQSAKQQASAAEIDAQKPFSAKRLEIYEKVVTLASAVAQKDLPPQVRKTKRQELNQVVNGPLALVAQDKVFSCSCRIL